MAPLLVNSPSLQIGSAPASAPAPVLQATAVIEQDHPGLNYEAQRAQLQAEIQAEERAISELEKKHKILARLQAATAPGASVPLARVGALPTATGVRAMPAYAKPMLPPPQLHALPSDSASGAAARPRSTTYPTPLAPGGGAKAIRP